MRLNHGGLSQRQERSEIDSLEAELCGKLYDMRYVQCLKEFGFLGI